VRRFVFQVLGCVFVGLAVLGIVLPVLPTTPFVLLAAVCFARGSERAYQWLLDNRVFGPLIREWRRSRSLPLRVKVRSIALLLLMIGGTIVFFVDALWMRILLALIAAGVTTFLVRIPTTPEDHDPFEVVPDGDD
jgi:hypothetical protein